MSQTKPFLAKVAISCFMLGAAMEGFMIKTGFYERVTSIEADRAESSREEREAFMASLRHEVLRQAKEKGVTLPPVPVPDGGRSRPAKLAESTRN